MASTVGMKTARITFVECDGTGVCGSDYDLEEHVNVRRPIYPLELEAPPLSEEEALAQSLTVDAGAAEE